MSEYNYLIYKVENQTALIKINRPEVYGALNVESKMEIIRAIRSADKDESVRSIVLSSEGKAFCTGQDLNDRSVNGETGPVDLGNTLETEWNPLVNAIRNSKKMVIGAINGVCAGAGLSVALACDYIIAKPNTRFISGFSKLGLIPDAGATFTFVRSMGRAKTIDFFLFNEPLMSEEMEKYGLINKVSENYLEDALDTASRINNLAPKCVEMIKKNTKEAQDISYNESMTSEVACQRFLGNSNDYQEGLKAFFEKRSPEFKGN